jgi:ATP-binding cassette subfamily C (CFTR/MRP) protein 1
MPHLLQVLACFERIEEYCLSKPVTPPGPPASSESLVDCPNKAIEMRNDPGAKLSGQTVVSFDQADISWSEEPEIVLRDLNLTITKGIAMIIGPVGSGKSALIESILGQASLKGGLTTGPLSKVGYCSQTPWIMSDTIQQNITGGSAFDQKWYDFTILACGLEEDIQNIPGGDMYRAGSKSVSLSGGQKQRVVRT